MRFDDDFLLESACELRPTTANCPLNSLMDEGLSMLDDRPRPTPLSALAGVLNDEFGDESSSAAVPFLTGMLGMRSSSSSFAPLPLRFFPCNMSRMGAVLGGDGVEAPQPIAPSRRLEHLPQGWPRNTARRRGLLVEKRKVVARALTGGRRKRVVLNALLTRGLLRQNHLMLPLSDS